MDTAIAPSTPSQPKRSKARPHYSKTVTQAVALQSLMHRAALTLGIDFDQASTPAERKDLLPFLAKATDAWSTATAVRQDAQGRPRAGSLSPAERAAMRQRKSQRSQSRAPTLAKPVVAPKESLSAP